MATHESQLAAPRRPGGWQHSLWRAARVLHRTSMDARLYGWAGAALLAVMFAVAVDAAARLPAWGRLAVALAGAAGVVRCLILYSRSRKRLPSLEYVARRFEARHPEWDNALINGLQFQSMMERAPSPLARELMASEIRRAADLTSELDPAAVADHETRRRRLRWLQWVGVAFALSALVGGRVYWMVLPRYLDPFGDHPPFSLTRFHVQPRRAAVPYGDGLVVQARITGKRPHSVSLMTSTDGRHWAEAPMDQTAADEFRLELAALHDDIEFYVLTDTGRSRRGRVHVLTAPVVREAEVRYEYPEYTGREPETTSLTGRGVRGVQDTIVTFAFTVNRPLADGVLVVSEAHTAGERRKQIQVTGRGLTGQVSFAVKDNGRFRLDLRGEDDMRTPAALAGPVKLVRDERPVVYIRKPGRPALATPDSVVPIEIEAEDNFGLRRLQLHRVINESPDMPLTRDLYSPPGQADKRTNMETVPSRPPRRAEMRTALDLGDLGVRPGDVITYYATAYDTDPQRRNQTDSQTLWIEIVSEKQYQEWMRAQTDPQEFTERYEQILRGMRDLAEQQRQLEAMTRRLAQAASEGMTAEQRQRAERLQRQQEALLKETKKLAQQAKALAEESPLFDIEPDLKREMQRLAGETERAAGAMSSAAQEMSGARSGRRLQSAASRQQEAAQRLERAVSAAQPTAEVLAEMRKLLPLYLDLERLRAVVEAQRMIVLKSSELKRVRRPTAEQRARMEELSEAQGECRQALAETLSDMEQRAGELEGDHPEQARQVQELAHRLQGAGVDEWMEKASTQFAKHKGPQGHAAAAEALKRLQGESGACGACRRGLNEAFGGFCRQRGISAGNSLPQFGGRFGFGLGGRGIGGGAAMGGFGSSTLGNGPTLNLSLFGPQSPTGRRAGMSEHPPRRLKAVAGEPAGGLSPSRVETLPGSPTERNAAETSEEDAYAAEYERLVREYFRRVAEDSARRRR